MGFLVAPSSLCRNDKWESLSLTKTLSRIPIISGYELLYAFLVFHQQFL